MTQANPHLKPLLIAGALAAMAVALGMLTLSRQQSSADANAPLPVHHAAKPKPAAKPETAAKPAAKPVAVKPKPQPSPFTVAALEAGMPKPVAAAFADNAVVVVTVYAAGSEVDELAKAEAQAGAELASSGFAAVDATTEGASGALTKVFGVLPLPISLVLTRESPTQPYVELRGFADRETVAQAARNATPSVPTAALQTPWARQATALCSASLDRLSGVSAKIASSKDLKGAAPLVEKEGTSLLAALRKLTPPTGRGDDVTRFLALQQQSLDLTLKMASATVKNDLVAYAAASSQKGTAAKAATSLAFDLGASACATPF